MFHWTLDRVIAALAAGVPEVVSAYNTAYAEGTTFRVVGPANGAAHEFALQSTARWLRRMEEQLFEENVEILLETLGIAPEPNWAADRFAAAYEAYDESLNPGNWA